MTNQAKPSVQIREQRSHRRLPMTAPVTMELGGTGHSVTVQNHDISWGGVRFAVPREKMPEGDAITIKFPWTKGNQFSANAEVVRKESLDDQYDLVAARFSSLTTADQRRLEKLLQMLQDAGPETAEEQAPMVPILEVLIGDTGEMQDKLGELAEGQLRVTVFEAYQVNQSIRLILGEIAGHPALRLRARVSEVEPLVDREDSAWSVFEVRLQFEHPIHELRAAAASLLKQLAGQPKNSNAPAEAQYAYH